MAAVTETTIILNNRRIQGDYRVLTLKSGTIGPRVKPGQFIHLRLPSSANVLLRRPFSVFQAQAGRIVILYKTVGKGTEAMAALHSGEKVNILGPLGNGFPPAQKNTYPLLVAGGYGMAALHMLAQSITPEGIVFVGGKTADDVLCVDKFKEMGWKVRIATEDGSIGQKGLVTHILDKWIQRELRGRVPEFFACGPDGLLKAVCRRVTKAGWNGWVSMDRHMGCGLGACLACVQKVCKHTAAGLEHTGWARVCTEGPVFACRDIVLESIINE